MLPWLFASFSVLGKRFGPYITFPVAVLVGTIGYNLESYLTGPTPPNRVSTGELRQERLLNEMLEEGSSKEPLGDQGFVPKTIFEKNISPSLVKNDS